MNNKNIITKNIILLILTIFVLTSGCVTNNPRLISGIYYHNQTYNINPQHITQVNESIIIYNDGTFAYKNINEHEMFIGTINKQNDQYIFTGQIGFNMIGRFQNGNLISDSNITFIKSK